MTFIGSRNSLLLTIVVVGVVASVAIGGTLMGWGASGTPASYVPGPTVTRRLTPEQYQLIIADTFGPAITIGGRFDANMRVDGLAEIGAGRISVSAAGMEQYDAMARSIASQVMEKRHRDVLMPCAPKSADGPDEACAKQFLAEVGRLLFRRPLLEEELAIHVEIASDSARILKDFYSGLSLSLAGMLSAPQFLFRYEALEPDPDREGGHRLDSWSKATRLSFFLWNSAPDDQLLTAAEKGELDTARGLARQVDRMIASPRLEAGMRAFFSDMLGFEALPTLAKDATIYPKFNLQVGAQAREQTLRTLVHLLLTQRGDYRDIFTARETFLTRTLAAIYKVPLAANVPNGSPDTWQPYAFASDDPRAGILAHVSFLALHSHAGRSSPTLRGKALRQILLCQNVPAPPANVTFDLVNNTTTYKTARERLAAHATEPACAGCHKITDPMGLALENFDGAGAFRTTENGAPIDASGTLDGVAVHNAPELGAATRNNAAATACLVNRLASYSLGRLPSAGESKWLAELKKAFAEDDYVVPELMRRIATAPEFYRSQEQAPAPTTVAGLNVQGQ